MGKISQQTKRQHRRNFRLTKEVLSLKDFARKFVVTDTDTTLDAAARKVVGQWLAAK